MLKFYYAPISANSQRVWITLLEKQIPFEPIIVNLDGEQFQSEFTAINPLQQVPAICPQTICGRRNKNLNCFIKVPYGTLRVSVGDSLPLGKSLSLRRTVNIFTNRAMLISPNIYITKSEIVCGQCPPYKIANSEIWMATKITI